MMAPGEETEKWLAEVAADRAKIAKGGCDFLVCGIMGPNDLCDFCRNGQKKTEPVIDEPEWIEDDRELEDRMPY